MTIQDDRPVMPHETSGGTSRNLLEGERKQARREHFDTRGLKRDLRRRTIEGGAITIGSQLGRLGLHVVSTMILARLLSPHDFGLVAMATAVTGFLLLLREMGLSTATIQRSHINHDQISTLFWINLSVGLLIAGTLALLAQPVARFYRAPELTNVVLFLSLGFPVGAAAVQHRALLQRHMRFGALGAIELVSGATGVAVAIVLALRGAGYWALVAMPVTMEVAGLAGTWAACDWRPGLPRRASGVRSMLGFGGGLAGFNFVNYLSRHLDNILIGRYLGAGPLGLYSRAYSLLMLPLRQVNVPLGFVALPVLSRLIEEPERYRRAYCDTVEKIQMLSVPGMVWLVICRDWVILLLLGRQWVEAASIFGVLGLAALPLPLCNTTSWLFTTQARTHELFRWGIFGALVSTVSFVIGLSWGVLGVAGAYAVGLWLRSPVLLWYVSRRGPVTQRDLYRTFKLPGMAACAVAIVLFGFRRVTSWDEPVLGLSISLILGVLVSLAVYAAHPEGRKKLAAMSDLLLEFRSRIRRRGSAAPAEDTL